MPSGAHFAERAGLLKTRPKLSQVESALVTFLLEHVPRQNEG